MTHSHAQHSRTARTKQEISNRTVTVPDSDCRIWVGALGRRDRQPVTFVDGRPVNVKKFLRRGLEPVGRDVHRIYRTTCGVRRCVEPSHQMIHREFSWRQWSDWVKA